MRRDRKTINQMNVVPYIDVMLVLLVIFMVTAPLINPGQVELPSMGQKLSVPVQPLEVTLRTDHSLWLRDLATGARSGSRATIWSRACARRRPSARSARGHRRGSGSALRGRARRARPASA